jgi:DNA-binding MarR family transcriptional regulator
MTKQARRPFAPQDGIALVDSRPRPPDHARNDLERASGAAAPADGAPAIPEDRPNLRILRAIRRIIRGVDLYSKQLTASSRITTPQLMCLLAVVKAGTMTATSISREIHVSPSTVVGILDRLEEKKLIQRQRNRDDRRVVAVIATDEGRRTAEEAPSPLQKTLADALCALPDSEQAEIARSLERVVNLMEAQHIDAAPILETGPLNGP